MAEAAAVAPARGRNRCKAPWLLAPALLLFLGVFIVPLAGVFYESLGRSQMTVAYYLEVFNDAVLVEVLIRTLVLSLTVTAICLVLGYPIALLMLRSRGWLQRAIGMLIVLPLWPASWCGPTPGW